MMATAAIYGAQSGIVRRVVANDSAANLAKHVGEGEALYVYTGSGGSLHEVIAECEVAISSIIGKQIENSRCAVVNEDGTIAGFVQADPAIDSVVDKTSNQTLVTAYSNEVTIDCTYNENTKEFAAPIKTIDVFDEEGNKTGEEVVGGVIENPVEVA